MNAEPPVRPPTGWGDDELTSFLDSVRANQFATFHNKKPDFGRLIQIDTCFMRVFDEWTNPKNMICAQLMFRSHAAFRAACSCATAGQLAESFPLLRTALENAGYALHINRNSGLDELWLRRHDDEKSFARVRKEFSISNIRKSIKQSDRKLAEIFDDLYQRTIDYGAHPNERGMTTNLDIEKTEDRTMIKSVYLHEDGLLLDFALRNTAQIGVSALLLFQEIFSARFEILGVRSTLLELRRGL